MSGPISVDDVLKLKRNVIPIVVFDAINHLLAESFNGHSAIIKQKDIVAKIIEFLKTPEDKVQEQTREIYSKHWLDIEDLYREQGWEVEYDKPGYNETYDANFRFSVKK